MHFPSLIAFYAAAVNAQTVDLTQYVLTDVSTAA